MPSKPADPWRSWSDIVAGKAKGASPHGADARFTQRAPAAVDGGVGVTADGDADGLDDGFEDCVADAFTPVYHVSNGEYPWTGFARFADAPNQVTVSVRSNPPVPPISHFRVQPLGFGYDGSGQQVSVLRLDYLTLWNWDDGLVISGACIADLYFLAGWVGFSAGLILDGLQAHEFDNERSAVLVAAPVAEPWVFNQNPGAYSAYSFYTAGHEVTFTDTSAYYFPSQPVPAGSHINGSSFIADPDLAPKLTVPLW
ncbi:MAG TPA: hypothetical protein VFM55_26315 [Micromonosporaceae bacterium]|nr:hypothetical protein [Micromonosporaceae bacterium]